MSSPKKAKLSRENSKETETFPKENGKQPEKTVLNNSTEQKQQQQKEKVRVWWAPTEDEEKTGYGGAYWPAQVLRKQGQRSLEVLYDNGDSETVDVYDVFRADTPVNFGEERKRLEPGEFCEVFNESETDPCAWFGKIEKQNKRNYLVAYPFHDVGPELVKDEQLRRARVFNEETNTWQVIRPLQDWKDGCVCSPRELLLVNEEEVEKVLSGGKVVPIGSQEESSARELKIPRQAQMNEKLNTTPIIKQYQLEQISYGKYQMILDNQAQQTFDYGQKPILCQSMQPGKDEQVIYYQDVTDSLSSTPTIPQIKPVWINPRINPRIKKN